MLFSLLQFIGNISGLKDNFWQFLIDYKENSFLIYKMIIIASNLILNEQVYAKIQIKGCKTTPKLNF